MFEKTSEEINLLPLKSYSGKVFVIDSLKRMEKVCNNLCKAKTLGFDTESRPIFVKGVKRHTSLLQLYDGINAYLFRLRMTGFQKCLKKIMENPDIVKVGAAINDDINMLSKAGRFIPANFVDLQIEAKELNITEISVKKLTANLLGFRISKGQQTSNWDRKTLTPSQITYAATDAWVCYLLYYKMLEIKTLQ